MALARSQSSPMRLYSVSHRILRERDAYYHALEKAALETTGTCDITAWLSWFAGCLGRAMDDALEALSAAEQNAALRERAGHLPLNHRQLRALELLIREPEETLTATRWARINHSTREEAEAGIDGMVRAMLWRNRPRRASTPHTGSHAAGDGEGRTENRATGHHLPLTGQDREIAGRNGKIAGHKPPQDRPHKSLRKPLSRAAGSPHQGRKSAARRRVREPCRTAAQTGAKPARKTPV